MEKICGIYMIFNKDNWKVYIGQAVWINRRWKRHKTELRNHYHRSGHLQKAWNKYGENAFVFNVIEECMNDKQVLKEREQYWIDFFDSANPERGYNTFPSAGSCLGFKHSDEAKRKIAESNRKRTISEESKRKNSESHKGKGLGKDNPFYSKKHSEESRKKMSQSKIGKYVGEKNPMYGKARPNDVRKKISETRTEMRVAAGENNPNAKLTWEKVGEIREKYVRGNGGMLAREYGVDITVVQKIIHNKSWKIQENTTGGQ